jgi:long-chain acyl-CoA synthetase
MEKETAMELSDTIAALIAQQAAAHGSETILRKKERGIWKEVTWSDLEGHVKRIGQGLLGAGLNPGETVAVLSEAKPESVYVDLAILDCGAIGVAINPEDEALRVGKTLLDSDTAIAVVEDEEQLDKVLGVRDSCPALRSIVILDMKGLRDFRDPRCMSLAALIAEGSAQPDRRAAGSSVSPQQIAAYFVSGCGAIQQFTHSDILRRVDAVGEKFAVRPGDERLVVLPMSDPTERVFGLYLALRHRIVSNYLESPDTATENLREVKPSVFGADIDSWSRLHGRISAMAEDATIVQKTLYNWAIRSRKGPMRGLANSLVLAAVREELGFSKLRVAFVGEGKIPDQIGAWARALGITIHMIDELDVPSAEAGA